MGMYWLLMTDFKIQYLRCISRRCDLLLLVFIARAEPTGCECFYVASQVLMIGTFRFLHC